MQRRGAKMRDEQGTRRGRDERDEQGTRDGGGEGAGRILEDRMAKKISKSEGNNQPT